MQGDARDPQRVFPALHKCLGRVRAFLRVCVRVSFLRVALWGARNSLRRWTGLAMEQGLLGLGGVPGRCAGVRVEVDANGEKRGNETCVPAASVSTVLVNARAFDPCCTYAGFAHVCVQGSSCKALKL